MAGAAQAQSLLRKRNSFSSTFLYVRPEPVLAKRCIVYANVAKYCVSLPSSRPTCCVKYVGSHEISRYLLRSILTYQPKDLNRDWSPHFSTLQDKNGWIRAKTARNLNLGVSRNRFCDFLAGPDSRSFSRFYTNIERSRYCAHSTQK
jgi:hypothetical protein